MRLLPRMYWSHRPSLTDGFRPAWREAGDPRSAFTEADLAAPPDDQDICRALRSGLADRRERSVADQPRARASGDNHVDRVPPR